MAGRGRGKSTLSREQLQSLGALGNDIPPVMLEAPPTYPQLMTKPVAFPVGDSYEKQLVNKFRFRKLMQDMPYAERIRQMENIEKNLLHHNIIDLKKRSRHKSQALLEQFNWKCMPNELYPQRSKSQKKIRKIDKDVPDIEKRLEELAKKETLLEEGTEVETKRANSEDDEEEEEEEAKLATDDEFDGDNDYGNNYFDNGESYDDNADDPMDDGPVF